VLIPYKLKVPARRFPYVTVALVAANVLVFLLTSDGLDVHDDALDRYALHWGASPLITHFTSMFLHGDILHLLGNMLYLSVFGQAVEDRLGPLLYTGLYFSSGLAADVAIAVVALNPSVSPFVRSFGASGCISGVLGACLYLYAWSPVRVLVSAGGFWPATALDLRAIWLIGSFFALNLAYGLIDKVNDVHSGVAYFAHVGGTLLGLVVVWALGFKRDPRMVSVVQAKLVEGDSDRSFLSCQEVRVLVEESPDDENLSVDYAMAAMLDNAPDDLRLALQRNPAAVITRFPEAAAHYLLTLKWDPCVLTAGMLLHLALQCETNKESVWAVQLYDMVAARETDACTAEIALYRSAKISWRQFRDGIAALDRLDALLARFPRGALVLEAEDLRDEIMRRNELAA